jgi:tetratricopeptide (TPR) repeat protein
MYTAFVVMGVVGLVATYLSGWYRLIPIWIVIGFAITGNLYVYYRGIDWLGYVLLVIVLIAWYLYGFFDRSPLYTGKNAITKYNKAIEKHNKAIQQERMYLSMLYFNRGSTYKGKGDYDNAIADYEAALQINPNYEAAKKNLEEAKRLKEQSVANNPATAE